MNKTLKLKSKSSLFITYENRLYWLIHTLIGKSTQQRMKLIDLHDKYLTGHKKQEVF